MSTKNSGHGGDPLNFEGSIENSVPRAGLRVDCYPALPNLSNFRVGASRAVLSATSGPDLVVAAAYSPAQWAAKWDHGDDETVLIAADGDIDEHFASETDDCVLIVEARKVDSADENADLALVASLIVTPRGVDETNSLTFSITSAALAAAGAGATHPFEEVIFDFGAAAATAGTPIPRGARFLLTIGPSEAVGTTDMDLEVLSVKFRSRRHPAMYNRALRLGPIT